MINLQLDDSLLPDDNGEGAQSPDLHSFPVDARLLESAALQTLQHEGLEPQAEITIVLGDDEQLRALNLQFLGIDAPTDVLSFPADETDLETGEAYLGDIILSYPRAQAQAAAGGHSVEEELQLLVVHGVLHLLGYDHAKAGEKAAMWAAQADILESLGASIRGPAE